MDSQWISVEQTAKLLGRRPETVMIMIKSGELPTGGVDWYGYRVWRPAVEQRLQQKRREQLER